jgi:hypothetical protein
MISLTLISTFYLGLLFLQLIFVHKFGKTFLHFLIIVGPVILLLFYAVPLIALTANLAIISGCYGENSITNSRKLSNYSNEECERILYWTSIHNIDNKEEKLNYQNSLIYGSKYFYEALSVNNENNNEYDGDDPNASNRKDRSIDSVKNVTNISNLNICPSSSLGKITPYSNS